MSTLRFRAHARPNNAMELVVEDCEQSLADFLHIAPERNLAGLPVSELFMVDRHLVDEWMEFVVKVRFNPDCGIYDSCSGDLAVRRTLQFLQVNKQWAAITVTLNVRDGTVSVDISPPEDPMMTVGIRHFMNLKQTIWLGNFVEGSGNWEIDLENQTIFLSRTMAATLQFADDAVIVPLEQFLNTIHPEDLETITHAIENVHNVHSTIYSRANLNDGSMVCFNSFAIPSYDQSGKITHIIGCSHNITEKERASEQLHFSEQRFRGIVENSQELFLTVKPDGYINYVSPNVCEITGYQPEEVVGSKIRDFIAYPEDIDRIEDEFKAIARGGAFTKGEYRICRRDKSVFWLFVRTSVIVDTNGKIKEVVVIGRDITEDKNREEALRYVSLHDAMTGVLNRFAFEEEMARIERDHLINFGIIITDLNGLKLVNDAFGHQKGDELLIRATEILSGISEYKHPVYRLGGDEFAIFAFDTSPEEVDGLCKRLEEACRSDSGQVLPISMSWGSAYRYVEDQSMEDLFRQAEGRMYNRKLMESRSMHSQVLVSLKDALHARIGEMDERIKRMEKMIGTLCNRLRLPESDYEKLMLLASMHDIGKVAIPDQIINKPGSLTDAEWEVMRRHSEVGCRIAMTSQELSCIANEICCHHERWDGSGYPYGHSGDQIPLLSRIISVVDAYDVMTHHQGYKDAVGHAAAIEELKRCAGTQFDPKIVEVFLESFA